MAAAAFLAPRAIPLAAAAAALLAPTRAAAHGKWFSDFSFAETPRSVGEVLTPTFVALALLSVAVVAALVPLERWLERRQRYHRVNEWLRRRADHSRLVMRIGAGAVLLLAWQADI